MIEQGESNDEFDDPQVYQAKLINMEEISSVSVDEPNTGGI